MNDFAHLQLLLLYWNMFWPVEHLQKFQSLLFEFTDNFPILIKRMTLVSKDDTCQQVVLKMARWSENLFAKNIFLVGLNLMSFIDQSKFMVAEYLWESPYCSPPLWTCYENLRKYNPFKVRLEATQKFGLNSFLTPSKISKLTKMTFWMHFTKFMYHLKQKSFCVNSKRA